MRLKHRVKLQKNTASLDAAGQPIESWSTYHQCWADVRDVRSVEDDDHAPIEGQVACEATIRYPRRGRIPQSNDRLLHGEGNALRTINITGVQRLDGDRRFLKLLGTEVQDG